MVIEKREMSYDLPSKLLALRHITVSTVEIEISGEFSRCSLNLAKEDSNYVLLTREHSQVSRAV